ncbi:MAG: TrmH family RNA methyltransferase [Calditrichaeota bacterium]|nr:MAG: TrmH family RNA methyltransferase [Calditrichota bacterium]
MKSWPEKHPERIAIVDNIRSLHNVGAIFRTADGAGFGGVILCGITAQPPRAEIRKSALGAEEFVPWKYVQKTQDAIASLRRDGYQIIALECTEHSQPLDGFHPVDKIALVIGNEYYGISNEILDICDEIRHLPMRGEKISLNVSVAFGIAAYELAKHYDQKESPQRNEI